MGLHRTPWAILGYGIALVLGVTAIVVVRRLPADAGPHTCMGEIATIVGTGQADDLQGTPGRDVIVGLGGPDTIAGGAGDDLVCAGEGDDIVWGGHGADELYGGPGHDRINGDQGSDKVVGGGGNDLLTAGEGNDTLVGMNGDDQLRGGPGDDELWGSPGADLLQGDAGHDLSHGGEGVDRCDAEREVECDDSEVIATTTTAPPVTTTTTAPPVTTTTAPPVTTTTVVPPTPTTLPLVTGRPAGPLVPERGVLIGGYVGARGTGATKYHDASRRADVVDYEAAIGRGLDIAQDFYPPHQQRWNVDRTNWHLANGRIPMITWRPGPISPKAGDGAATAIANGVYDADIRARARQARAIDGLFFSRLFHEMDGQYRIDYDMDGAQGAATFRAMWQRIHRIFAEEGATNVVWVWSPAGFGHRDFSPAVYYPGDRYVDWIAVDPYLWVSCRTTRYSTMTQAMKRGFFDFMAAHPDKPAMLAEWGAGDMAGNDFREQFIASVGTMLAETPQVAAVVYFDSNASLPCQWQLEDDPSGLAAYRDLITDPAIVVDPSKITRAPNG